MDIVDKLRHESQGQTGEGVKWGVHHDVIGLLEDAAQAIEALRDEQRELARVLKCTGLNDAITTPSNIPNVARDRMLEIHRLTERIANAKSETDPETTAAVDRLISEDREQRQWQGDMIAAIQQQGGNIGIIDDAHAFEAMSAGQSPQDYADDEMRRQSRVR